MLLIFSSPPAKGSSVQVSLNKEELMNTILPIDEYFSNPDNIKTVVVKYVSSPGRQKKTLKFDFAQSSPTSYFTAHERARSIFRLHKVIVYNHSDDNKKLDRGLISNVELLDVDME